VVVAEDEAHDILEGDIERDRGDRHREGAGWAERTQHERVVEHARDPGHEEGCADGGPRRQAERRVGDVAGEGADGGVRGHREVRKAEHREDRGEADGRHGQDRAGHQSIQEELERLSQFSGA